MRLTQKMVRDAVFLSLVAAGFSACAKKPQASIERYDGTVVPFRFDSSTFATQHLDALDGAVAFLKSHPNSAIIVEGHTDRLGTDRYNLDLGDRRARAVKAYLMSKGIAARRIVTVAYGESSVVGGASASSRRAVLRDAGK